MPLPPVTAPVAAPPAPVQQPAASAHSLWLCLQFPALPLEAADAARADEPFAVFHEARGVREVYQASAAAQAAGIHAGQSVNAALALLPGLVLEERDERRETEALAMLAGWAERYSSFVTLTEPDVLLIEIGASLSLFGGLKSLRRKVLAELAELGYTAQPAIAPTPLAATWLARAGSRRCIRMVEKLPGALGPLSLDCLAWPAVTLAALHGMGLATVADLVRLPRDGFAKRFGPARLAELDRALGRQADPRAHFRAPQPFHADCDLDGEHDDPDWLLAACDELLGRLEHFLRVRQLAAERLVFRFYHLREAATYLKLGCLRPAQDRARWQALLRVRFERLELAAPVIAIRLEAEDCRPCRAETAGLSLGGEAVADSEQAIEPLLEQLAARIGSDAVESLHAVAEHRPDYAWRRQRLPGPAAELPASPARWNPPLAELTAARDETERLLLPRPLWLLEPPERLACRDGRPWYHGALELTQGPERIETGWWDAHGGVSRDYYIARNPAGAGLWIYRERDSRRWFLHGRFG